MNLQVNPLAVAVFADQLFGVGLEMAENAHAGKI